MYLLFIYRVLELSTILSITKSITYIYLEYSKVGVARYGGHHVIICDKCDELG